MKTIYKYSIASALALLAVACQQVTNNVELPADSRMMFDVVSPNAHTRVSNGAFEAEDEIGVYVTDYVDDTTPMPLQISGNRANNEALLFDGASWVPECTIYWGEGKSDVYAYYPYMAVEDIDEQPFSVALDQTVEGAYEASDLLWAKATGVAERGGSVSLAMNHAMSRLVVKIMAGKEYIGSLPKDATVHLHSTVTDARISLANGSVVKDSYSGAKSIKMRNLGIRTFADGEAVVYEAIVVPQMLETSVPLLEINSKSVSYLLEDMFNFKPGVSYTYTAVLNTSTTAIKVEIGCEVEDWNNIGGSEGEGGSGSDDGEDDGIDLSLYTDLSADGTANCYLIQAAGNYKFKAVMGNSDATVGNVKKTEVLWETFGTDVMPNIGDLIKEVGFKNGYVYFSTPETFRNGNASIAVRNSKDVILWSWHIWCSEEGWNDQVYANNAGIMMDRNIGATSATPGDVGTLGLMYQHGRKDPFMGSCSILSAIEAASTGKWSVGNYNYTSIIIGFDPSVSPAQLFVEQNPMMLASNVDMRGWKDSRFRKGVHDPCPVGYRVPDGGNNGFWAIALTETNWDSTKRGFTWLLADSETTAWYPTVGIISYSGGLYHVGNQCNYWSASEVTEGSNQAYNFESVGSSLYPTDSNTKRNGCAVRCVKEK